MTIHSLQHLAEEARFYWSMLDTALRLASLKGETLRANRQALEKELLVLGSRIPGVEAISSVQDLRERVLEKIRNALQQLTRELDAASLEVHSFRRLRRSVDEASEIAVLLSGSVDLWACDGTDGMSILELARLRCATADRRLSEFVAECESAHPIAKATSRGVH